MEVAAGNDDDGIGDCVDNCTDVFNPLQIDSNSDGYGNFCDADVDNDGVVGGSDLGALKKVFLTAAPGPPYDADIDFDSTCVIGGSVLGIMKKSFLGPPGPSGLACANVDPDGPGPLTTTICPAGGAVPSPCP